MATANNSAEQQQQHQQQQLLHPLPQIPISRSNYIEPRPLSKNPSERAAQFNWNEIERKYQYNVRFPHYQRTTESQRLGYLYLSDWYFESVGLGQIATYELRTIEGKVNDIRTVSRINPRFHPNRTKQDSILLDYSAHEANWQRLSNCRNESEMITMLKEFLALRQALCFDPRFVSSDHDSIGNNRAKGKKLNACSLAKKILKRNPKVLLLLSQTAREVPFQLNALCLVHWIAWRRYDEATDSILDDMSMFDAMQKGFIDPLSPDYVADMIYNQESPLVRMIDFDDPHPLQDDDFLLEKNNYEKGCLPIWYRTGCHPSYLMDIPNDMAQATALQQQTLQVLSNRELLEGIRYLQKGEALKQRSDSVPVPNQQGSENLSNQMESQAVRNEPVLPMNDQGASNEPNWAMNAFPDRLQMTNISQQPTVSQPAESQQPMGIFPPNQQYQQMGPQVASNEPAPPMNDLPSELDPPYLPRQDGQTHRPPPSGLVVGMRPQVASNEPVSPMNDLPSELDPPYLPGQDDQTRRLPTSGLAVGMRPQVASNEPNWAMNAFPDHLQLANMVNQMSQQPAVSQTTQFQQPMGNVPPS